MICAAVKDPIYELGKLGKHCTLVEFRLDLFGKIEHDRLEVLCQKADFPIIFTLRSQHQGGSYSGTEEERLCELKKLAALKPDYIDLEHTVPASFFRKIKEISPKTQIIASYHDFEKMPEPTSILKKMEPLGADLYKMAFKLSSSSEALSLLLFMKEHSEKVIAMGMGPFGLPTRILSPIFGGKFVYGTVVQNAATAPGQPLVSDLADIYKYASLDPSTAIYGLIGDPVDKSLSHISHNAVMDELRLHAVYCKFQVSQDQLSEYLTLAKQAGIRGMSVTMPLKEKIIPLLDSLDPWAEKVGAVNTLLFKDGRITGFNTDGAGALDAIEENIKVQGKRVVFLGAGGASRAVVAEAVKRGARVTILNRDAGRAYELARKMNCEGGPLEQLPEEYRKGYDILINTTPSALPIDPQWIIPGTVVMDLKTQPMNTEFLKRAKEKGCALVFGYEMFVNQAVDQYRIWYGDDIDPVRTKRIIEKGVLKNIEE